MRFRRIAPGLKDIPSVRWNYRFEGFVSGDWTSRLYAFYSESRFAVVNDWFRHGLKGEYVMQVSKYVISSAPVGAQDFTAIQISFEDRLDAIRFSLEWER